jgi:tetratricopeptide (TPR) repeat protein
MGSVRKELLLNAEPETVWDAVRDFGALHTRLVPGFVTDTRLEGRDRTVTFASGSVQREPLVDLDDDARRLVYSAVDSPLAATHYNGSVQVFAVGDGGSRLVWVVDFLPDELAGRLDAAMDLGVAAMRRALDDPAADPADGDWERRLAAVWASLGSQSGDAFRARIDELVAELPADSARAVFERACAFDSTGRPDLAVPLYREALERGLDEQRRRRATIQLASSLRNLDGVPESLALLQAEREAASDELDDAVSAFLALALADSGQERKALSIVLIALARHLPRYQRSVAGYAARLPDDTVS